MQVWITWGDSYPFACRRGELHPFLHAGVLQVARVARFGLTQFGKEGVLKGALGCDALEGVVLQHLTQQIHSLWVQPRHNLHPMIHAVQILRDSS